MLLDRSVLGKEALVVFKILKLLLQLLRSVNRNSAHQKKGMEIATF